MSEQKPMVTLSAAIAHNAVAGVVELYQGIMADHEREKLLLAAQIAALKVQLEVAQKELQALRTAQGSQR